MSIDKRQLKDSGVSGGTYLNPTLIINDKGLITSAETNNISGVDTYVTGGTYSSSGGTITQTNNTGGTITITGITSPTGLEAIDEGNGIGWRLIGRNPANYGDIGLNAVDLSRSPGASSTQGATGSDSISMGYNPISSGSRSIAISTLSAEANNTASIAIGSQVTSSGGQAIAIGNASTASGDASITIGSFLDAYSYSETVLGYNNTSYSPNSTSAINNNDKLLVVGNGLNSSTRSDAFTILKSGLPTFPSLTTAMIDGEGTGKVPVTREWIELQGFSGGTDSDTYVTGGTFTESASTINFTNNTGGTFSVTGITSAEGYVTLDTVQTITNTKTFNAGTGATNLISLNASSGIGFSSDNTSTGKGIYSYNDSTGQGIYADNFGAGEGIFSLNSGEGEGIYSDNTGTGKGIYSINKDDVGQGIYSENINTSEGIYSLNTVGGKGIYSVNSGIGIGISNENQSTGIGIYSNASSASTGFIYVGANNGVNTFTVDKSGNTSGNTFNGIALTTTGSSSNFLNAEGNYISVSGGTQLSGLTDVNTSTPTNRNVLVADGVDWESRALVSADISDLNTGFVTLNTQQTISGRKIFSNGTGNQLIVVDSSSNTLTGFGGDGDNIFVANLNGTNKTGFLSQQALGGVGYIPFIYKNTGGTTLFKVDELGDITGNTFVKSGGSSSQFLKADGSTDSTVYQVVENVSTKTTDYTTLLTDGTILVDATGGNVIITLITPVGNSSKKFTIKKIDSTANTVTVTNAAGIDGTTTKVYSTQYSGGAFQSNGTQYYITANF